MKLESVRSLWMITCHRLDKADKMDSILIKIKMKKLESLELLIKTSKKTLRISEIL